MPNTNQEHVLVPATDTATGVVMVIWTDPNETPLEAIGRLNQEVIEAKQGVNEDLMRALKDVEYEAGRLAEFVESAQGYLGDAESSADAVKDLLNSVSE